MPFETDLTRVYIKLSARQPEISLLTVMNSPTFNPHHFLLPYNWLITEEQVGPYCGLYSAKVAFQYGFPEAKLPLVRKLGAKDQSSIRQFAKSAGITQFGEIFNVESYLVLAKKYKIEGCEILAVDQTSVESFVKTICDKLKQGFTLISSCDVTPDGFLSNKKGLGAHWATILGYFYLEDQCYFCVYEGKKVYRCWSGAELFKSNQQLPLDNPNKYFYKDKCSKEYVCLSVLKKENNVSKINEIKETTLEKFRFTLFAVPAPELKKPIDLNNDKFLSAQLIHYAKEDDFKKIIELKKLKSTISLDVQDSHGNTPLIWAARRGYLDMMIGLIQNQAALHIKNNNGNDCLMSFTNYLKGQMRQENFTQAWDVLQRQDELEKIIPIHFNEINLFLRNALQDFIEEDQLKEDTRIRYQEMLTSLRSVKRLRK